MPGVARAVVLIVSQCGCAPLTSIWLLLIPVRDDLEQNAAQMAGISWRLTEPGDGRVGGRGAERDEGLLGRQEAAAEQKVPVREHEVRRVVDHKRCVVHVAADELWRTAA